jgi:hypothetical protein
MRRAEVRRRRRDVFLTLLGAVAVTLVLAVALGGTTVWMVQLAVDVAFAGYVLMLVSIQQQAMQAEEKVRYIRPAPRRTSPEPQLLLRRSGS